jgi:hypothetical protein
MRQVRPWSSERNHGGELRAGQDHVRTVRRERERGNLGALIHRRRHVPPLQLGAVEAEQAAVRAGEQDIGVRRVVGEGPDVIAAVHPHAAVHADQVFA